MASRAWLRLVIRMRRARRAAGGLSWKLARTLTVRAWAAVLIFVVVWAGYAAVAYLVRQVFYPADVPQAFLAWQGDLHADRLRDEHVPGMTDPSARAPIGHYHGVKQWFQHDPTNGCTVPGCHQPLPHQKTPTVRAFANMHTTFLNCMVCHATPHGQTEAGWVDTRTGKPQSTPAILQLIAFLDANRRRIADEPGAVHGRIVELLRTANADAGHDDILEYLLLRIDTSQPGSPVWVHAVAQLTEELPDHARGEYGAKIALGADVQKRSRELRKLAEQYQDAPPASGERSRLNGQIHAGVVPAPQGCLACHTAGESPLNLEALGYPPARTEQLKAVALARMAERVRGGQVFYLPLSGEEEPPEEPDDAP